MPRPPDMIAVFADLDRFPEPRRIGSLRRHVGRGGEVFSFEYDRDWLRTSDAFGFDPDLGLVQGPHYPASNRANFGVFLDSAPDRWGRVLMQRRENFRARREGRAARSLSDWDFLLGVHDETRLGALRFQDLATGGWLDTGNALAAPPITSANSRRPVCASSKAPMITMLVIRKDGLPNCSRPDHRWVARDQRLPFETSTESCASRSFPAGKTVATLALGNWWLTGWPRGRTLARRRCAVSACRAARTRLLWQNDLTAPQAAGAWLSSPR